MTAVDVVRDILGELVGVGDEYETNPKIRYIVSRTWSPDNMPISVGFDDPRSGSIGLRNLHGTSIEDITEAAHEACHCYLHWHGHNMEDQSERDVSQLAEKWLAAHLSGPDLAVAIMHLNYGLSTYNQAL